MNGKIVWHGGLEFEGENDKGHNVIMDVTEEQGGQNKGMTPKELVLQGLMGCTAMDVVSILKKMRVEFKHFEIKASATQTDTEPKVFAKIDLCYSLTGDNLPREKVLKAITLSEEKYCGVSAMLEKTAAIEISYEINGEKYQLE